MGLPEFIAVNIQHVAQKSKRKVIKCLRELPFDFTGRQERKMFYGPDGPEHFYLFFSIQVFISKQYKGYMSSILFSIKT